MVIPCPRRSPQGPRDRRSTSADQPAMPVGQGATDFEAIADDGAL
jgi:hypothetical protein